MIRPKSPCIKCDKREAGCHGRCEKYKAYKTEHNEYAGVVRRKIEESQVAIEYTQTRRERMYK